MVGWCFTAEDDKLGLVHGGRHDGELDQQVEGRRDCQVIHDPLGQGRQVRRGHAGPTEQDADGLLEERWRLHLVVDDELRDKCFELDFQPELGACVGTDRHRPSAGADTPQVEICQHSNRRQHIDEQSECREGGLTELSREVGMLHSDRIERALCPEAASYSTARKFMKGLCGGGTPNVG